MKLSSDGETVSVETDTSDVDFARAIGDGVQALTGLLQAVGVGGEADDGGDGDVQPCASCGEERPTRPLPVDQNGQSLLAWICFDCQQEFIHGGGGRIQGDTGRVDVLNRGQPRPPGGTPATEESMQQLAEEGTTPPDPIADAPDPEDDAE